MKPVWTPLEHKLKATLESQNLLTRFQSKKIGVAISGGLDSVVLLNLLRRLAPIGKWAVCAVHFHHGKTKTAYQNEPTQQYRDLSLEFVTQLCRRQKIELFTQIYEGPVELSSEDELREARWTFFKQLLKDKSFDIIATGHHADDLLETRLLRLIRGCGPQGLVAMQALNKNHDVFRPLLSVSKEELVSFAQHLKLKFLEDPSNQDSRYLRNWVRNEWLPALENKSPGAAKSLTRSLEILANHAVQHEDPAEQSHIWHQKDWTQGFSRPQFQAFSAEEQRRFLAFYLLRLKKKDFRKTHIEEIRKYLDSSQISHTFKVAQLQWTVNAEQIKAAN
jgi:tRNA(Ile)-lysidine synthase